MFLVDTIVVSETRKTRPDERVARFFSAQSKPGLYLSVLTSGELRRGAAKKALVDASGAAELETWVDEIEATYESRILQVDLAIATRWGKLWSGRSRPVIDTLIAATALHHGPTLVTRNTRDVADTGVLLLNPWEA
jgi:predicted nucleic acid-binding protein